jgi:phage terminase large subunit GpA-like protein
MLVEQQLRGSLDRAIERRIARMRQREIRSMERFAEEEIVLPSGKYENSRFRCDRQPFTRHWFRLVDSGRWRNMFATGPVQASKTLCCSTTPVMYHLFELGETVVYAIPTGDMAMDKWKTDLLPVLRKTRYYDLMPDTGAGSKGGDKLTLIEFKNGARLRFMGAGGDDATRSGFTTRVVVMTEMDKFKTKSKQSKESNPFQQVRDRLMSWGEESLFYGETTVSTVNGLIWQQYLKGTGTQVYLLCPHCSEYVLPEREHLRGWQDAPNIYIAKQQAKLYCPSCGKPWTEAQRRKANEEGIPLHRGQKIVGGEIVGEEPQTDALSFRWTCVHNHMSPIETVAGKEWDAEFGAGAEDPDDSELTLVQKFWATPPEPEDLQQPEAFKPFPLMHRMGERMTSDPHDKGIVPAWAEFLTCGVDCKKGYLHYSVLAVGENFRTQIIDNGIEEVHYRELGVEQGIYKALLSLFDNLTEGYPDEGGEIEYIQKGFADAGYMKNYVVAACLEMLRRQKENIRPPGLDHDKRIWYPILGFGLSTDERKHYSKPRTEGPNVLKIGLASYQGKVFDGDVAQVVYNIDVDHWKGWVRDRLACSVEDPTAMTFWYTEEPKDHLALAKHLCAEAPHREFVEGKGYVDTWLRKNRNNHFLDATTYAGVAAWWNGARLPAKMQQDEESSTTKLTAKTSIVVSQTIPDRPPMRPNLPLTNGKSPHRKKKRFLPFP